MGSEQSGADVDAALVQLRRHVGMARKVVDDLIGQGVSPQSLAWALAELDQLQATVDEIDARRGG